MEAAELMTQLEATLLDLDATPDDRALIDQAFRSLHTLKGSGAMFGFERAAAFTHHVENAFDMVRKGTLSASPELVDIALTARDRSGVGQRLEIPMYDASFTAMGARGMKVQHKASAVKSTVDRIKDWFVGNF